MRLHMPGIRVSRRLLRSVRDAVGRGAIGRGAVGAGLAQFCVAAGFRWEIPVRRVRRHFPALKCVVSGLWPGIMNFTS